MTTRPGIGLLLLACAATTALGASRTSTSTPGTVTYKWVDAQGVTHYGDHIPPEFAQGETAVLNHQGVPLKDLPARLTPAQQDEARRRDEAAAKQKQHDSFLLTTYTSARDIEQLRDERLAQIEGQIGAARGYIESVDSRLASLRARANNFKPYAASPTARRLPDALAEEIVQTLNEARSQREILDSRQKEQKELRATFQSDIDRYRALTSH
jgi:Domain of unknown function (DUF4124)